MTIDELANETRELIHSFEGRLVAVREASTHKMAVADERYIALYSGMNRKGEKSLILVMVPMYLIRYSSQYVHHLLYTGECLHLAPNTPGWDYAWEIDEKGAGLMILQCPDGSLREQETQETPWLPVDVFQELRISTVSSSTLLLFILMALGKV